MFFYKCFHNTTDLNFNEFVTFVLHGRSRSLNPSLIGNNGVDRPARLSRACFSLNQSFALTSISLRERPFLYEMSGFPV